MSHEGYHRIETADMPRPDVNYLLTRLDGQLLRAHIWNTEGGAGVELDEILVQAMVFSRQLREALSERHIDVI